MTEAKRNERRQAQRESYERCKMHKLEESESSVTGKRTEVYPLKNEDQILAMQEVLLQSSKKWGYRNWLYFMLGINLGRRGGDIAKLKWGDLLDNDLRFIDEDYEEFSYITEEKTSKEALIHCNSTVKACVQTYLNKTGITPELNEYIFKSAISKEDYIEPGSMRKILKKAAEQIGFKRNFGTHSLRKTFGYMLWKQTENLLIVQMMLGHSRVEYTRRYIGLDEEMKAEYFEMVKSPIIPMVHETHVQPACPKKQTCQIFDFSVYKTNKILVAL